jgi:drug/metabolite transporter (DMT)-like permease
MKKTLGIICVVLGAVMLIWTGFSFTKKEKVVDAGPVEISADKKHTVNWPPYAGGILVLSGIVLLVSPGRRP